MKKLLTILTLLLSISLFSQNPTTEYYKVSDVRYFSVTHNESGDITQQGSYLIVKGELKPDGKWVSYNTLGKTIAHFDKGTMIKIKTFDGKVYTKSEIDMEKMKIKIRKLETLLVAN